MPPLLLLDPPLELLDEEEELLLPDEEELLDPELPLDPLLPVLPKLDDPPDEEELLDEDDEEGYNDVDGIVDPLAGLRNEHTERFEGDDDEGVPAPADDREFGGTPAKDGWNEDRPPLDLSGEMRETEGGSQDEFELGDDQRDAGSPLATKPGRKQPLFPGEGAGAEQPARSGSGSGGGAGSGSLPGNTLFERMANLSRGASNPEGADDEDEDDDGGSSGGLNIPRFLGRQNNQ